MVLALSKFSWVVAGLCGFLLQNCVVASAGNGNGKLFTAQTSANTIGTLFGINLISNEWANYAWTVGLLVVFWGIVLIKFLIGWIIWWWFYYGKNGGLYGSHGKHPNGGGYGYPSSAPYSKIGSKYPHSSRTPKLVSFIMSSIETLNKQFA